MTTNIKAVVLAKAAHTAEEALAAAQDYVPLFQITRRSDGSPMDTPIVVEHRNMFLTLDRQKHLAFRKLRPYVDVRFIFEDASKLISKRATITFASWCDKHGFIYAEGHIPAEWTA